MVPDNAKRAKRYNNIKLKFRVFDLFFIVIYLLLFQVLFSDELEAFSSSLTRNHYCAFTIYLAFFGLIHYALSFPLHLYPGFILEHKFKLSNQRFFSWLSDDMKGTVLSSVIFLIFIQIFYVLFKRFDTTWWILMSVFWFSITILLAKMSPIIIIPIFFKYSAVEERLKKRVIELAKKCEMKVIDVYKIDFSKKTKKLNAAVTGLGRTRRVILADNLVEEFNESEVLGVLAHEFGHHKLKHIWKLLVFGFVSISFSFYILYLASSRIAAALGASHIYDIRLFPVIMLVLFIAGFVITPLSNAYSRKLERAADFFALNVTQDKESFISLMQKLAERNLADPNPPTIVKLLFYDHPPISERIRMASEF
ncbi:MAG: M48 family metallopeptidase [Candidatus Omnitrophota bacterium]